MAQETVALPEHPPAIPACGEDAEPRLREVETLREMAVAAADTVDPDEIFAIICNALPGLVGADFALAALPLFDAPREWCIASEPPREAVSRLVQLLEQARETRETVVAAHGDGGARVVAPPYGSATAVAVPLPGDGPASGALLVGWHGERAVGARAVRLVETVAEQAGGAFRNAARFQALRQTAER
ncbi:MAG TPA: GAF domain-containing protein, partial [Longimicrobium sp.]